MTGTTATYSYSAAGSATDVENFEPLGQKIHPHDPEDYEPPLNGGLVGSADDAEWQCEAGGQFYGGKKGTFADLPFPCQKRMLQDIDRPLKDTFGWGGKKESSARVSILIRRNIPRGPHDTGPDNGWTYAANSMRAAALKSTAKDDDDTDCRPGRPCLPEEEKVDVPISAIDMSEIPGFVDASQSGGGGDDRTKMAQLGRRLRPRQLIE